MKYLTLGTDEIREDLFRKVKDTDLKNSMKPVGGLWLTEYDEHMMNYNHWVDFILNRPHILFYKNHQLNPFIQPCSVVSLKDNVNLYVLHNDQTLDYLMKCFPLNNKFSYEELSKYYDGIYVNLGSLFMGRYDKNVLNNFSSFGVSSLVLFNLDCVDYYQPGVVNIEPFDYEDSTNFYKCYEMEISPSRKKILKRDV